MSFSIGNYLFFQNRGTKTIKHRRTDLEGDKLHEKSEPQRSSRGKENIRKGKGESMSKYLFAFRFELKF
ncbi:MAG: hypothetical protein N2V74_06165 [Candidatus Methanospirare jalkutatii]|nr:MAG: hypothetical protein N2V74_06165 [Candidatus Methanospirare jalkutatii]